MIKLVVVLLFCVLTPTWATVGIDISLETCEDMTYYDWDCLVNAGYEFAIIEIWQGGYEVDSNIAACINGAWDAGMAHVDVYAFMCPQCYGNNPYSLIQDIQSALSGVTFGMLWFDIEQASGAWYYDLSSNANFIQQALNEANDLGFVVGFYSNAYEWSVTMGDYTTQFSSYPLWYADYDYYQSFYDFESFGGWSSPAMKQYQGDYYTCNIGIDLNWYPDGTDLSWYRNSTVRAVKKN